MILTVVGTRPEAIKLAPVIMELRSKGANVAVVVTGQQPEITIEALKCFSLYPETVLKKETVFRLDVMLASFVESIGKVISQSKPLLTLVQGDTTSALAGTLASFYSMVPVGHVEAGLRTHNPYSPFPEEGHRKIITTLASMHFAPSERAVKNLMAEGINSARIFLTGNTVIDALRIQLAQIKDCGELPPYFLVTAHRRENFGRQHREYFDAINTFASEHLDLTINYILHTNPNVTSVAKEVLRAPNIAFKNACNYKEFVTHLQGAIAIITDSGGIQEEASFLGIPTLITRKSTERNEVIETPIAKLIQNGTDLLQTMEGIYQKWKLVGITRQPFCCYGSGDAAHKIVEHIYKWLG